MKRMWNLGIFLILAGILYCAAEDLDPKLVSRMLEVDSGSDIKLAFARYSSKADKKEATCEDIVRWFLDAGVNCDLNFNIIFNKCKPKSKNTITEAQMLHLIEDMAENYFMDVGDKFMKQMDKGLAIADMKAKLAVANPRGHGKTEPYMLDLGMEWSSEIAVVNPIDQKLDLFRIVIKDVGSHMAVLAYEGDVGVVVVPHKEQCFVVQNLGEVLPQARVLQAYKGGAVHKVMFRSTDALSDEQKQFLPQETRGSCAQWSVYRLEPRNDGEISRIKQSGKGGEEQNMLTCFLPFCWSDISPQY